MHATRARTLLALLPPLLALALQWACWGLIQPYVWFLFYPAVFLSSWIGGLRSGLVATALSTALVWWFFVPPQHALLKDPRQLFPAGVFSVMGVFFAVFHDRLLKANQRAAEALAASHAANEEISRLYEKTRELDDLKTRFFAAVSHELRTPLTLVLGPAQRLRDAPETPAAARRDLDVIVRNARTLLRHVNDLLDVSKLEAARMQADYVDADVSGLVRLVAGHFESLADEKRLAWTLDVPDGLRAQVDPEKLRRIVLNLLSNAFKFTPAGGRIRLAAREADGRLEVEVADSGPGIPPDQRDAVFDRFCQLEGGSTRRFGGTGLGLAIARDFATLHGGTITVTDATEGGSLFRVSLPREAPPGSEVRDVAVAALDAPEARQAADELREQPSAAPDGPPAGTLVLVVEDNPDMRRFICESLSSDHRVAAAVDGGDGLRKALELRPDLILTDLMMPEISGEDLVRAVRSHAELARTPIVLLTAKADDELRVRLLREGAQDHLTKPFTVEELRARIDNLLTSSRLAEEQRRLADENARLYREAERALQARDQVLGVVAHDLRNPLAAIRLHATLLRRQGAEAEHPKADAILRATHRMSRLIDDLLDVTRIEAGGFRVLPAAVCPGRLVTAAVEAQRSLAASKSLELEVDLPPDLPDVWADRDRLLQVFENLIGNAVKFTGRGGRIVVGAAPREAEVLFRVADTGDGIPAEDLPHVFDRFWQAPKTTRHGAGLGLPIVKGIVEAHGGRVWVDSEPARGSTFFFTIKVA